MATQTKKDIEKVEDKPMTVPNHIKHNSGRGSENIGAEDLMIPRIGIVQSLSAERKRNDPNYIPGAEEGNMFNSVTRQLYTGPILVVPVFYRMEFLLWKLRAEGGGFRGAFPDRDSAAREYDNINDRVEIVDTAQQFCLVSSDGGSTWEEAVISMSKSNARVSKLWNADIRLRTQESGYDRFALIYEVRAVEKSNDKGTFFIFDVHAKGFAPQNAYTKAEKVYEAIVAGTKMVAYGPEDTDSGDMEPGF